MITSPAQRPSTPVKTEMTDNPEGHSETALRLIVTGERMFGDHGLDGVSLRQIAAAAGNTNNYAVQHHFGSKEAFLQAIYNRRIPTLDAACRRRLKAADKAGPASVRKLVEILLTSLLDAVDDRGEFTYARFLTRLMHVEPAKHPGYASTIPSPAATEIDKRLRALLAHLPAEIFELRFRLVGGSFLFALSERVSLTSTLSRPVSQTRYLSNALDMAAAAFAAPLEATTARR
jgi:AcrR family transcriptional regulator